MNKKVFDELKTAYRLAVRKFTDIYQQREYFEMLTEKGPSIFNIIANYEKSKQIRGYRQSV